MGDIRDKEAQLRMMREECRDLAVKINTLEMDKTEHELVMAALKPLDPARKCFRMIGNVVVERTVAEVLPAVEKNRDQISGTVKMFTEMMAKKQQAASDFAAEHKIQEQRTSAPAKEAPTSDEGSSQGVLI
jgi:prefoldin subunit 2